MRSKCRLSLLTCLFAALVPASAAAQDSASSGEFSIERFEPAPGSKNFLNVERLRMDGGWGFSAGLWFNYSKNPFVLVSCQSQTNCSAPNATNQENIAVVADMMTWDLALAISPIKRLQIGLRFPVSYVNGSGINVDTGTPLEGGLKGAGVGDPTLEAKARLWGGAQDPFAVGGAIDVTAPLGHATEGSTPKYIGDSSPITVGLRGIFDGEVKNLMFAANLRALIREDARLGNTTIGPEFRYGAGLGYRLTPVLQVMAEGNGGTRFSSANGTNSLEIDGALRLLPQSVPIVLTAGGGAGVIQGVGVPAGRALVGVMFTHEIIDTDGDGIPDDKDQCPTIPEDKDGFQDADGCPDYDNDNDGIPDKDDKCPNQPETINGYQDKDGCPDELPDRDHDGIGDADDKCPDEGGDPKDIIRTPGPNYGCLDSDHDGIPDFRDKCPHEPEDTDGFEDTDGCPDPDNDHDGIPDEKDECIDKPEVYNGYQDADGCPDEAPDRDHDGIPDNKDKCPDQPENYNGFQDADGCPDKGPALVQVTDEGIKILQKVEFATGSDKITGKQSFQVLDAVVGAMKGHPDIFLVEVAGHTDNVGDANSNRTLSQKRAEAVVKYLTDHGIDKSKLIARGYGPDKPIADNKTTAGKQKNRRVEFNILKSVKKGADMPMRPVGGDQPAPAPGTPAPAAPTTPSPATPPPATPAPAKAPAAPPKK